MTTRLLVMGDNHGDTESLHRVLDDIGDEHFDVAVHVGDFTCAWRESRRLDDEAAGRARGAEQLRAVEPLLAELDDRARHGLAWVWGNQDYFGDLDHDLAVGTEVPVDGHVTVGGVRFTADPTAVGPDDVLVTHMEHWALVDHFAGRAHFCGNTHRGRFRDRRLNAAYLELTHPESGETSYGGYFVVELGDGVVDVELRSVGDLERHACDVHRERGVQFAPPSRPCMYCRDERVLMRELSASAFHGLVDDETDESVAREDLVAYATGLWDDPPAGFADDLRTYLRCVDDDRYAPLARTGDERLVLADRNYAY